jgi:hypothetical protein
VATEEANHQRAKGEKIRGADDLTVLIWQGESRRALPHPERSLGLS